MEKIKNPQYEYANDALDFANSVYSMQFPTTMDLANIFVSIYTTVQLLCKNRNLFYF